MSMLVNMFEAAGWANSVDHKDHNRSASKRKALGVTINSMGKIKGFMLDDERLKRGGAMNYFDELLARIRDILSSFHLRVS